MLKNEIPQPDLHFASLFQKHMFRAYCLWKHEIHFTVFNMLKQSRRMVYMAFW